MSLPALPQPLYVGLLALHLAIALLASSFWALVLFPTAVALVLCGARRWP